MKELEELYKDIQPKIYSFFYVKTLDQNTAEDLTHDTFYEAMKGFNSFAGKSTIQTWLFSIANNLLKKYYRSKKYRKKLVETLSKEDKKTNSLEEELMIKERSGKLIEQINQLDSLSKEIVTYRIYGELSFKEIGELIGKSENYTRVAYHRAKLKLQKEMEGFHG